MDLIGLVKYAEPVAYVPKRSRTRRRPAKTPKRPLDEFEMVGLNALAKGEDMFARSPTASSACSAPCVPTLPASPATTATRKATSSAPSPTPYARPSTAAALPAGAERQSCLNKRRRKSRSKANGRPRRLSRRPFFVAAFGCGDTFPTCRFHGHVGNVSPQTDYLLLLRKEHDLNRLPRHRPFRIVQHQVNSAHRLCRLRLIRMARFARLAPRHRRLHIWPRNACRRREPCSFLRPGTGSFRPGNERLDNEPPGAAIWKSGRCGGTGISS